MQLGFKLACLLVQYLDRTEQHSAFPGAAVLYNPATGGIEAWATDSRVNEWDVGTPATNVLRGFPGSSKDFLVLVSRSPTMMCLGMAGISQVSRVVEMRPKAPSHFFHETKNDLAAVLPLAPRVHAPPHPDLGAWMTACEALLRNDGNFRAAFERCPDQGEWPRMIADAYRRDVAPRALTPNAPSPADGATAEPGPEVDAFWMTVARRLTGVIHSGAETRGHNIGCILVGPTNQLLAWGVNTSGNHPTNHAETKCIWMFQERYAGAKVPAGSKLYTTLQSCYMCAGTIKHACSDQDVSVIYADSDSVRNSALQAGGGARERRLVGPRRIGMPDSVLQDRPDLANGHHLLAISRWDRMRRAFHQQLDRGLALGAYHEERDRVGVNQFLQLMQRSRPEIQAELRVLDTVPPMHPDVASAVEAFVKHRVSLAEARGDAPGAIGRMRAHTQRDIATLNRNEHFSHTRLPRMVLNRESARHLGVEKLAIKLPLSGGAPVLLHNPLIQPRLHQAVEIRRLPAADPRTLPEAMARTRQRIADITTQMHALDLLLWASRFSDRYSEN